MVPQCTNRGPKERHGAFITRQYFLYRSKPLFLPGLTLSAGDRSSCFPCHLSWVVNCAPVGGTNTARPFTATVRSKSSRRKSSMGATTPMPALLTRMSMPPSLERSLRVSDHRVGIRTVGLYRQRLCAQGLRCLHRFIGPIGFAEKVNATSAPSCASRLTMAAPMLRLPPVTNARLFTSRRLIPALLVLAVFVSPQRRAPDKI